MLEKLLNYISYKIIPIVTGENKAPFIYITNMGYLNHKQLHKSILKSLTYVSGKCVDIGSGNSIYRQFVSPLVDEYISVDKAEIHQHMFKTSKEKFINADIKELPFDSHSIDTILLTQVLEHIDDPFKAMDEIKRVIKKEGILILSVPFIYQAHATPYDFHRFSEYGLRKICKDYDFEILEFHYQGYVGTTIFSILNGFIWEVSSKNKLLRNTILLPFILGAFCVNNCVGLFLDLFKMKNFSPNFWMVVKSK